MPNPKEPKMYVPPDVKTDEEEDVETKKKKTPRIRAESQAQRDIDKLGLGPDLPPGQRPAGIDIWPSRK